MKAMTDFLAQGGFAGYVWSAYGMTLALLVFETLALRHRRRTILARLRRLLQLREAAPMIGERP